MELISITALTQNHSLQYLKKCVGFRLTLIFRLDVLTE